MVTFEGTIFEDGQEEEYEENKGADEVDAATAKLEKVHEVNADLYQALQQSRIEDPSTPLLADGYILLKLMRMARSTKVDEI